ncbi:MAG: hypothetical protein K0V04_26835 [Deltaproteobacteria bacterium]|nr:hypothetical protein [Deltaproteobacteria bacterium]
MSWNGTRGPVLIAALLLSPACGDDTTPADPTDSATTTGGPGSTTNTPPATSDSTGSTSIDPDSSGSGDTSGGPAVCGNEVVEGLEQCDDGNDTPGDDCEPGCVLPPGQLVWAVTVDGGEGIDEANAVVALPDGQIVVVGQQQTARGGRDTWLAAYSPAGEPLWSRVHDLGAGLDDVATDVVVTSDAGALAITGWVEMPVADGADDDDDIVLVELDNTGEIVSSYTYTGPEGLVDRGTTVAVDSEGLRLLGGGVETVAQDDQIWLAKVDLTGAIVWEQTFGGAGDGFDAAVAMAATADGGFVAVGAIDSGPDQDMWISRRDGDGNELWSDVVDGGFGADAAQGVVVADDGTIYVSGGLANALTNGLDLWVGHYDDAGNQLWTSTWNGMSFDDDTAWGVDTTSDDSVIAAGGTVSPGQQINILTTRIDANGERWVVGTDGGSMLSDIANDVVTLADDSAVVVGRVTVVGESTNAWIGRYAG